MTAKATDEGTLQQQLHRACECLERRLRAGQACRAEELLAEQPALAADSDATLELIYFEYVLREELGGESSAEEWYRRFPQQQASLKKILHIHHDPRPAYLAPVPAPIPVPGSSATLPPSQTVAQASGSAGRRLHNYELLEELGRGSMGVVYKARDLALDRIVALKMILAGSHAASEQLDRFHREARAVARLQHPHIVQIHEIGAEAGWPFLCMEYVAGVGLDRLLSRWQEQGKLGLTPPDAARLLETLARAVHYAHQQGVVHRDLKPANILLQVADSRLPAADLPVAAPVADQPATGDLQSAIPKIADFGLAKFLDGSTETTQTGHLVGTPSFMAPEQADGRAAEVGPATDVYALGVILYQLLTGRPPFQAPTIQETLELVRLAEPAPPRQLQPYLPRDLQTICLKCLAKEPVNRYASAAALADDLQHFRAGEPIRARPVTASERTIKWIKRRPVVAGLLLALILALPAGAGGVLWQWQRAEQHAADFKYQRDLAIRERHRADGHLKRARAQVDRLARLGDELYANPLLTGTGKAVLEDVLEFYEGVLREESNDPLVRREAARTCDRVAHVRHGLGQWSKAIAVRRQQSDLLERLLADGYGDDSCRHELALSLRFRGNILRDINDRQGALALYRQSAAIHEQLLSAGRIDARFQVALANTLINTATVLPYSAHGSELKDLYGRALTLLRAALQSDPANIEHQNELALCLEDQAMFYWDRGERLRAESGLVEALKIRQGQFDKGKLPRSLERYLARTYRRHGIIQAATERPQEAEKAFERSLALLNKLIQDFPFVPYHRIPLIETLSEMSNLLEDQHREEEWQKLTLQIIVHQEKLVQDFPLEPRYLEGLAGSLRRRRDFLSSRGEKARVATLDRKLLAVYQQTAALYQRAAQTAPGNAARNNDRAWFLATCPEESLRDPRQAVRLAQRAVAADGQMGSWWNTLGVACYRAGDWKAAVAALDKSMQLRSGGNSYDWFFLAMAHYKLDNQARARDWLERGGAWLEKHQPHNEELRRFHREAQALIGRKRPVAASCSRPGRSPSGDADKCEREAASGEPARESHTHLFQRRQLLRHPRPHPPFRRELHQHEKHGQSNNPKGRHVIFNEKSNAAEHGGSFEEGERDDHGRLPQREQSVQLGARSNLPQRVLRLNPRNEYAATQLPERFRSWKILAVTGLLP